MAITKTRFINYNRCPYYYFLDNMDSLRLNKETTFEEYIEEQNKFKYEVDNEQLKSFVDDLSNLEQNYYYHIIKNVNFWHFK